MCSTADKDNICPVVVVSSAGLPGSGGHSPDSKDAQHMDEAQVDPAELAADAQAAKDLEVEAQVLARQIEDIRKHRLPGAQSKAAALKARIEAAEEHQDPDTLALWSEYDALMDKVEAIRDSRYMMVATALRGRYSWTEVKGWFDRAEEMGCARPPIGPGLLADLLYVRKVPNEPFRERVLALPSLPEGDERSWEIFGHEPIKRLVGIEPHNQTRSKNSLRIFITYEQGVELARLLGMNPQQAGV